MALAKDRNTHSRARDTIVVPVAAATTIYAGALVAANASGNAVPGSVATTLTYLGRAEEQVVNAGSAGDKSVTVGRGVYKWKNSGSDPVTQASLGKACYIVDDETVAATNGTNTRSAAGIVVGLDSDGVWVE